MKLNNILFYSQQTVPKPMYTSGRHDYRGMKVEKEEGKRRGTLPNSSGHNGLMVLELELTKPLTLTSSWFSYWN